MRNFELAFKMFDLNGDGDVELKEFEKVRLVHVLYNMHAYQGTPGTCTVQHACLSRYAWYMCMYCTACMLIACTHVALCICFVCFMCHVQSYMHVGVHKCTLYMYCMFVCLCTNYTCMSVY